MAKPFERFFPAGPDFIGQLPEIGNGRHFPERDKTNRRFEVPEANGSTGFSLLRKPAPDIFGGVCKLAEKLFKSTGFFQILYSFETRRKLLEASPRLFQRGRKSNRKFPLVNKESGKFFPFSSPTAGRFPALCRPAFFSGAENLAARARASIEKCTNCAEKFAGSGVFSVGGGVEDT